MADYFPSEIVDILLILEECHLNYHEVSRILQDRYLDRGHLNPSEI